MSKELIERSRKRPAVAEPALVVTAATLLVSLAIAAATVSIGIARAGTLEQIAEGGGGRWVLAIFVALVIAGMGALTAVMVDDGRPRR